MSNNELGYDRVSGGVVRKWGCWDVGVKNGWLGKGSEEEGVRKGLLHRHSNQGRSLAVWKDICGLVMKIQSFIDHGLNCEVYVTLAELCRKINKPYNHLLHSSM